ncbi:MAG: IS630 family transposase, partial [Alphaproteobacteria bacterium]
MTKSLSVDLRERVVAVIDGGLSRRQAAARFGVSVSSAIRWHALAQQTGDTSPKRQGGDRRSGRIEAHADVILAAVDKRSDITLAELRALLAEKGVSVGIATLWR